MNQLDVERLTRVLRTLWLHPDYIDADATENGYRTVAEAIVSEYERLSVAQGEIPIGTWFRLRWTTGRVGKWHRAGRLLPHLTQQFCRCGRGVIGYGQRRYSLVTVETRDEPPPRPGRCNAWRKAVR